MDGAGLVDACVHPRLGGRQVRREPGLQVAVARGHVGERRRDRLRAAAADEVGGGAPGEQEVAVDLGAVALDVLEPHAIARRLV